MGKDGFLDQRTTLQLEGFLRRRRTKLSEQLHSLGQTTSTGVDPGADQGDRAATTSTHELNAARLDRLRGQLRALDLALVRLGAGTYGACDDCGEFIGLVRLQALPFTRRCRSCQGRTETATERLDRAVRMAPVESTD
jgi:DnaK suppressor protein